ncbi:hypothetical protein [Paenibacillus sp. QZ-Y1]|uniref:hypothetical protein n=1 Tax=Paenibacillus sp. QZ-Y1 TaxID=3414511 RepID=UPI003F7A82C4
MILCYFILQTYGVFQKEKVLSDYALAVDVNGKSYEAWPLINSFAAMDKEGDNRQLYYRVDMNHIQYLFHIAYQEYEVKSSEDNPYLAGNVNYQYTDNTYVKSERQYKNANDFINITELFHDKLDIDVKLHVDEEHKVVTIRMNKAEARS